MAKPRVVVVWGPRSATNHWSSTAEAVLAEFADRVDLHVDPEGEAAAREAAVDAALVNADGLVIAGWGNLGIGYLSAERLKRAPRLRFIGSTCHYRQAEFVDIKSARAHGVGLCETAPIMSPWVAEYELLLALAALRDLPREHGLVGAGGWAGLLDLPERPDRLFGRRVGLASFGEIHRHLATMLAPFQTDWQAYDPFVPAERIAAAGGYKVDDLVALAARSEIFFIATPPTPKTVELINRAVIEALPTDAVLVLVSRMAVVEQAPLLERLQRGDLRAAIDVYEPEPPSLTSPWRNAPNLIHTPHRAGNTLGAHRGIFTAQCEEARRFFAGEALRYPLRDELVELFPARAGVTEPGRARFGGTAVTPPG